MTKITFNNHNELVNLNREGIKNCSLNGFIESIGYILQLKLNDIELVKIEKGSYNTTY